MEKVLFVDDEKSILTQLKWAFSNDYEVFLAEDEASALKTIEEEKPTVVTLDISLSEGGNQGIGLLKEITSRYPDTKAIMITGNDEKENALESLSLGAVDYYYKPIDIDELRVIIKRIIHIRNLEIEREKLLKKLSEKRSFEEIIGECPEMAKVFETVRKVATTDVTVLITGESGTGKELVARAIHSQSLRKDKPFVVVNCGAIPENLLESELFGYEKGAFTGAYRPKPGRFEMADEGTVFLDEIGELSPTLQVKILRFLQEHEIERVGGNKTIPLDIRVLAATNKDLEKETKGGSFREDLYYRLNVVNISLPPLRDRSSDVELLGNYFLYKYSDENGRRKKGFSQNAIKAIRGYSWPGNVRELQNRVERAVIMASKPLISAQDLGLVTSDVEPGLSLKSARDNLEKRLIKAALLRNSGNISRAAKELDVSRVTLHDLIKKHNINAEDYKKEFKESQA